MGNSTVTTITANVKQKAKDYWQSGSNSEYIDCDNESDKLLIFGFIKDIEKLNEIYIPLSLIDLCFKYYQEYHPNIFILTGTIKNNLNENFNEIHCINFNTKRKYTFNIYDISQNEGYRNKNRIISNNKYWDSWYGNISFCRKFKLPPYIEQLYYKNVNNCNDKYNILFKCGGGYTNDYNASLIVFNEKCLNKYKYDENMIIKTTVIDGFEYELPCLNINKMCRSIWSFEHKSLFTMSCDGMIHQLQLINEYEWKCLPNSIINNQSIEPMVVLNNNKLCLLSHNAVQLFDLYNRKWSKISNGFINNSMNGLFSSSQITDFSLLYSGVFYDKIKENIFIGGGLAENKQKYFSLNKLKWYNLPNSNYKHTQFPILWCCKNQPFLLFIAGNNDQDVGMVEFYDLRVNNGKWINGNDNMQLETYLSINTNARIRHIAF